jgi:outer membrane lipoprotein carrier protein
VPPKCVIQTLPRQRNGEKDGKFDLAQTLKTAPDRDMTARLPLILVALWILTPAAGSGQAARTPDALAMALQKRYQSVRDFSADFTHSYRGGVLRTQTTERGTVLIKKPGLMRWTYTSPERKEFISDGSQVYSYIPADRQVMIAKVPADDQATTPALFLAGKGDIARDFSAEFTQSPVPGATGLKLTPRRREPEYDYLVVAVDPGTLQIRALTTRDRQGGDSTLTFTNLKENQRISDKEFAFRVPRGVEVITDGQRN